MKNVYIQEGFIDLDSADTKNFKPRRIYCNDVLWEIFQKARKVRSLCHDFVFTYKGRPVKDTSPRGWGSVREFRNFFPTLMQAYKCRLGVRFKY